MSFDKHQNANTNKGTDINKDKEKDLNRQNQTKPTDKSNLGQDKARQGGHQDIGAGKGRMDK